MKNWILDCHANKGAIESILSQVGHDEWTKAKIMELKYKSLCDYIIIMYNIEMSGTGHWL